MSEITYERGVLPLVGESPSEDFYMFLDGQLTGLGYFVDPAPMRPTNSFALQVDSGPVQRVAIRRFDDDMDRYMLVHSVSGMTFYFYFYEEKQVKAHAEAVLALGIDWTQSVEALQRHPLWKDLGRLNQQIIASILGHKPSIVLR